MSLTLFLSLAISLVSVSVSGTYMTPSDCPIQTCLQTTFQPDTDYFPVKINVTTANFAVNYYNNFKVLTNKYTGEQYVVTLCGTTPPVNNTMVATSVSGKNTKVLLSLAPTAKFFTGPITKIAIDETITANVLELLGARSLIAAMQVAYITSPCLHTMYDMHTITDWPSNSTLRAALVPQMDLILSGNYVNSAPKFIQASITVESSPMGRLEWVKYLGALLNREYAAQSLYDGIASRYNTLKSLATNAATNKSPVVAWINFLKAFPPYTTQDTWTIKNTPYQQVYTRDAGATTYTTTTTTYYNASDALTALLAGNIDIVIDETYIGYYPNGYTDFLTIWALNDTTMNVPFLINKQVWRHDKMQTGMADDWFERAIIQIDAVLQDLVTITHPGLLPVKDRVWFRNYAVQEGYGVTLDRCWDVSASLFPLLQTPVMKDTTCPTIPIETEAGYKPIPTTKVNGGIQNTVQVGFVAVLMTIVAMCM